MIDWQDCKRDRTAKRVRADKEMISSLIAESGNKQASAQLLELSPTTASSKISLLYDALRMQLEALALESGFKIYNHICYTAFLREQLEQSELAYDFDKLRRIRNSINYYGKRINPKEARDIIAGMLAFRKEVRALFE